MAEFKWKPFLQAYSRELLTYEEVLETVPPECVQAGWLGRPGASNQQIESAEKRLGVHFPPSYRTFLKFSNGWAFASTSVPEILPTSKIAWFRKRNRDWADAYINSGETTPIPDKQYFIYGAKQDTVHFRAEYLETALQITNEGDSAVVLLNPKVIDADGEWETWFFANWLPGAVRYPSFSKWLSAERRSCKKHLQVMSASEPRAVPAGPKPASTKRAQSLARQGQTDLAQQSLESLATAGDDSAAASLAELYSFQGRWNEVIINAGRLIANPRAVYAGNVFIDMVRLLGRAGLHSGDWQALVRVVEIARRGTASSSETGPQEWRKIRDEKIFNSLLQYAQRKGRAPHDPFSALNEPTVMEKMTEHERQTWYYDTVKNVDSNRPDLKRNPSAKPEYFFSLARGVLDDEALRLYESHGAGFLMTWNAAEYAARLYTQRGQREKAWKIIENNLKAWWPVDNAQVAPWSCSWMNT